MFWAGLVLGYLIGGVVIGSIIIKRGIKAESAKNSKPAEDTKETGPGSTEKIQPYNKRCEGRVSDYVYSDKLPKHEPIRRKDKYSGKRIKRKKPK